MFCMYYGTGRNTSLRSNFISVLSLLLRIGAEQCYSFKLFREISIKIKKIA